VRYIFFSNIPEHLRNVLNIHLSIFKNSIHIRTISSAKNLREPETSPCLIKCFIIIYSFVFPSVSIPERFKRIRNSIDDQYIPRMRSIPVSPSRNKIHGSSHSQRRKKHYIKPTTVFAQAVSHIFHLTGS